MRDKWFTVSVLCLGIVLAVVQIVMVWNAPLPETENSRMAARLSAEMRAEIDARPPATGTEEERD